MILEVRSPQELEKLRNRFKVVFTKTRYAVYDYEKDTLRAYSLDDGIRLQLSKDESFDISNKSSHAFGIKSIFFLSFLFVFLSP